MLTVHHLRRSQSERIVWLCEELGLAYALKCYDREPVSMLAPPEYKALHPMGAAPVITDDDLALAESGAIVDYVIARHGAGRFALASTHPDFATYLYWLHFANGNLQPNMGRNMVLHRLDLPDDNATKLGMRARLDRALGHLDEHLADEPYLAGAEFTAADIMSVFSLTTMRLFYPLDLAPWPNILAYLQRIGARPAYRSAMAKGDPGMAPMLT
jgi:glutathione S-transferase